MRKTLLGIFGGLCVVLGSVLLFSKILNEIPSEGDVINGRETVSNHDVKEAQEKVLSEQHCHLKNTQGSYYFPIRITEYFDEDSPCLPITIDDLSVLMKLDTGAMLGFSLPSCILDQIESKTCLPSTELYGVRGLMYEIEGYRIPNLKMGSIKYSAINVEKESEQMFKDGWVGEVGPYPENMGTIGIGAFRWTNLFLDLGHDKIAVADQIETVQKNGYQDVHFVKVPFFIEKGRPLEVLIQTSLGPLRCLIDTGSTYNGVAAKEDNGQTIEEAMSDFSNWTNNVELFFGEEKFGPETFVSIPIKFPIAIEAILGMAFLKNHLVFLDFAEKAAYFAKKPE